MKFQRLFFLILFLVLAYCGIAAALESGKTILVTIAEGNATSTTQIAIKRLKEYSSADMTVVYGPSKAKSVKSDLIVVLGKEQLPNLSSAIMDSFALKTISKIPLTVVASGTNDRSMLYAVYRLADLLKADADIENLDLFYKPRVAKRYVSFGATTHGRRYYRPELYWKTLNELPRYGYNGVIIYPGGGTPIGRRASPFMESRDGLLSLEPENTAKWKDWLAQIDTYGFEIMMTIPPIVPPYYKKKEIKDYYAGAPEPKDYLKNLKSHFRTYLELVSKQYPEVDMYMFNSTEGATFGRNERFFGHPQPKRFPNEDYLKNNTAIMKTYFDVLTEFFGKDMNKVCFWTHSYGLTSEGIKQMREVLFQYPGVTIIEDDFWNNNLWAQDLPAMAYLPKELRTKISENNPYAMFQIATDGEYYGGGSLPNAYPGSHIRSANAALKRGARMVIQRMDLHDRTDYGTAFGTMEIVPIAASKQLWKPTPKEPEIWKEWADRRFGCNAAPHIIKALQESKTVLQKGLSCNGIDLLGVGSEFKPSLWTKNGNGKTRYDLFGKPGEKFIKKNDDDVIFSSEYSPYQMNTHSITINKFRRNQLEAQEAVQKGLTEIEKARPHLKKEDYEMLKGIYTNGENVLKAMRLLGEVAYATNIMISNFDNVKNPQALFDKSISDLEEYLKQEKLIPEMMDNIRQIMNNYKAVVAD